MSTHEHTSHRSLVHHLSSQQVPKTTMSTLPIQRLNYPAPPSSFSLTPSRSTSSSSSSSENLMLITMELKKPTKATAWGMSLSLFGSNNQFLILGDAQTGILKNWITWCQVVPCSNNNSTDAMDISRLFVSDTYSSTSFVGGCQSHQYPSLLQSYMNRLATQQEQQHQQSQNKQFQQLYPFQKTMKNHHLHQQRRQRQQQCCLLPGDWIVAMDGYPPQYYGITLDQMTDHLRQVKQVTIVVLRSVSAVTEAMQILHRGDSQQLQQQQKPTYSKIPSSVENATITSARAAYHVWKNMSSGHSYVHCLVTYQIQFCRRRRQQQHSQWISQGNKSKEVKTTSQQRMTTDDTINSTNGRDIHRLQQPSGCSGTILRQVTPEKQQPYTTTSRPRHDSNTFRDYRNGQWNKDVSIPHSVASSSSSNQKRTIFHTEESQQHKSTIDSNNNSSHHLSAVPILNQMEWKSTLSSQQVEPFRMITAACNAQVGTTTTTTITDHCPLDILSHAAVTMTNMQDYQRLQNPQQHNHYRHHLYANGPSNLTSIRTTSKVAPCGASRDHMMHLATKPFIGNSVAKHKATTNNSNSKTTAVFLPNNWRNPLFKCSQTGLGIPYDDNWEFSPEEGTRSSLFLPKVEDFTTWLQERKQQWRTRYKVYKVEIDDDHVDSYYCDDDEDNERSTSVAYDFWYASQGYVTFDDWLANSIVKWKKSYSWNQRKRKRIQQECVEIVHLSSNLLNKDEFRNWLHIRKQQWKFSRRKRQRQRLVERGKEEEERSLHEAKQPGTTTTTTATTTGTAIIAPDAQEGHDQDHDTKHPSKFYPASGDLAFMDDMLEEEERRRKVREERPPLDIAYFFDANNGVPDDVIVHCFQFLNPMEHSKLLCINRATSASLQGRGERLWRQLCPPHWILPRRPRKPWHELYLSLLKRERLDSQKRWDDLLLKCSNVLFKGDHLQKIEKLVNRGLHVNYCSSVVCERNSLLNLAVIHQRHKVVRWLVEQKDASIETFDRGQFTPLMNAAWAGDRYLVRFFLLKGSDRTKIGLSHYSGALSAPDFKGLTAEGWARKRGHEDIADLILVGL